MKHIFKLTWLARYEGLYDQHEHKEELIKALENTRKNMQRPLVYVKQKYASDFQFRAFIEMQIGEEVMDKANPPIFTRKEFYCILGLIIMSGVITISYILL
jgi:hypothetical protein